MSPVRELPCQGGALRRPTSSLWRSAAPLQHDLVHSLAARRSRHVARGTPLTALARPSTHGTSLATSRMNRGPSTTWAVRPGRTKERP